MSKKTNGAQWARVVGTGMSKVQKGREDKNKSLMTNDVFLKACENVGIKPTKRQTSKWNNRKGIAFTKGKYGNV